MGNPPKKQKKASAQIGEKSDANKGSLRSLRENEGVGLRQEKRAFSAKNSASYLAASVALITFLVYLKSLQNEFVNWDDAGYVYKNPFIRSFGLSLFKWAFSQFYEANWHPLTWLSHALDYAVWGLNPLGHHLTNTVLHAGTTFLVVVLAVRLVDAAGDLSPAHHDSSPSAPAGSSKRNGEWRSSLIAGGVTGLLFGLHPLHVESVAWVAERKDLLCGLFFVLSLLAYTKYACHPPGMPSLPKNRFLDKRYLVALFCFFLALLSKPMAVSLPAVLLILDWYPLGRMRSFKAMPSVIVEKIPFIILSLGSSALTIMAQKGAGAMTMIEVIPLSTRLLVAAKALMAYLWKMAVPVHLNPFYAYPKDAALFSVEFILPVVCVLVVTVACIMAAKKQKVWLATWGYYVVTLVPVLGIIQVGAQAMADRYTYIPSLGPFLVIGLVAAWGADKSVILQGRIPMVKVVSIVAAVLLTATLSFLTIRQISVWHNSFALWNYVIKEAPDVSFAYDQRGKAFNEAARKDMAIEDFSRAISISPRNFEAYSNRGVAYSEVGQFEKALADFDRAIAFKPDFYEAFAGRGVLFGRTGLFPEAIESFNEAIKIKPDRAEAYSDRGLAYSLSSQPERALADFTKAIELNNKLVRVYLNRGDVLLSAGNKEKALADFRTACALGAVEGCNKARSAVAE